MFSLVVLANVNSIMDLIKHDLSKRIAQSV